MYTRLRLPTGGLSPAILRDADQLQVWPGADNPDWLAYQAWVKAGNTPSDPPAPVVDLAAYIAAGHSALRDGGVTVGGMRIKTDAESRGLIDGAYSLSQAQPEAPTDFKAASGWVTADSQTIQTVALAVGRWVQACYSAYRRLDEGRQAGTVTTTAQVDAAYAAVTLPTS